MIIKNISSIKSSGYLSKKLLLFFAGWGMDENPFREYCPIDYDLMVVYDYSSLSFDETCLKHYSEITVIAWSMGVWAASQLLQNKRFPIVKSIAVNGSPFPVEDKKGIPHEIYEKTLNSLDENNLYKFRRRMCGSSDALKCFLEKAPKRSIDDLRKELKSIRDMSLTLSSSLFKWDAIYIGSRDKIFPVENLIKAWEGTSYIIIDEEHYPDELLKKILNQKI